MLAESVDIVARHYHLFITQYRIEITSLPTSQYPKYPTMINRSAIVIVLAMAAATCHAFVVVYSSTGSRYNRSPLFSSMLRASEQIDNAVQQAVDAADSAIESAKMIMDVPPTPVAPSVATPIMTTPSPPKAVKKGGNPHKEGVFSPIVIAAGTILGDEQLNKIRGKVIGLHSDLIKSFVNTADSEFGKAVLRQLFNFVDTDKSGYLDKKEVATALNLLGFKWLGEKQVDGIFERADADGDLTISLDEFMIEAPRLLRTNLVKLAKANGGEMGLLV